mmetsp:Transcript_10686/g.15257  ORF Transcript_10686/g.15257 Transcript_10686/m.15257 type:complete len:259 (-) Transcript_10686:2532-3308(-)
MTEELKERGNLEDVGEEVNDEEIAKQGRMKELSKRGWQVGAAASGIFAILAVVFSVTRIITIVSGIVAISVAVVVWINQEKLGDIDALRKVQNKIRKQVNLLQGENDELSREVNFLEEKNDQLKATEDQLQTIADEFGDNVSNLVNLVKENGKLLQEIKAIIKADTLQNMYTVFLMVDRSRDYNIGEREVFELMMRMKIDPRIQVNENNLRHKMKENGGSLSITDLTKSLLLARDDSEEESNDSIFSFVGKEMEKIGS